MADAGRYLRPCAAVVLTLRVSGWPRSAGWPIGWQSCASWAGLRLVRGDAQDGGRSPADARWIERGDPCANFKPLRISDTETAPAATLDQRSPRRRLWHNRFVRTETPTHCVQYSTCPRKLPAVCSEMCTAPSESSPCHTQKQNSRAYKYHQRHKNLFAILLKSCLA